MTEYQKLKRAEKIAHTVEIIELLTGKRGVANSCLAGVAVFYGADDGSDDRTVTPKEFNRNFKITTAIMV